ncbi:MAG: hypothetical protein KAY24_05880 [Candidatus Eisenbacteria sp.]|nr:hypothetical protein [Candidatus Eisenbacteria bacterium]
MSTYAIGESGAFAQVTNVKRFLLLYAAMTLLFVAIYPWVSSSRWVSSSDFHACIEIVGSFIALTAGLASMMHFCGTNKRYFLLVGLGFIIAGSGDVIRGLFAWYCLYAGTDVGFAAWY